MNGFIHRLVIGGLLLCTLFMGCSREVILEPEESILVLADYQGSADQPSIQTAEELSSLLKELHACLFPNGSEDYAPTLGACYEELLPRMKAWPDIPSPPASLILSLKVGFFYESWEMEDIELLAEQFPLESELWNFWEEAVRFIWDCGTCTPDIYVCHMIWRFSPLKVKNVGELGWVPTVEPVLYRIVNELRLKVQSGSESTEHGIDAIYGVTVPEFKASIMEDSRYIAALLEELESGHVPNLTVVEENLSGRFMKAQAKHAAGAMELFYKRLDD